MFNHENESVIVSCSSEVREDIAIRYGPAGRTQTPHVSEGGLYKAELAAQIRDLVQYIERVLRILRLLLLR